jgi:hypothetical protein
MQKRYLTEQIQVLLTIVVQKVFYFVKLRIPLEIKPNQSDQGSLLCSMPQ